VRAGDAGGVYVAPEEIGEPLVLDADERALLGAWADRLVPGDGTWPPATATPVVGYIDALMDRAPAIAPAVRSALGWLAGRGFLGLAAEEQVAALRELEADPALGPVFFSVLEMTLEAYYRDPAVEAVVEARTGFSSRRPMVGTPLAPFDPARLDRVRALPPSHRSA
jgi:hypothetical protein